MKSRFFFLLIISALFVITTNCHKNQDEPYNWPKGMKGKIMCCDGDHNEIIIYDSNGITILEPEQYYEYDNPRWSPDGTKIACNSGPFSFPALIYLLNADGTNIHQLFVGDCGFFPCWSPSGSIFVDRWLGCSYDDSLNKILILTELDTNGQIIREFGFNLVGILEDCSPDGNHLLSSSYEYTEKKSDIYEVCLTSQQTVCLTDHGWNTSPKYSPDGNRIVFEYRNNEDSNTEIWKMNADGGDKSYLLTVIDTGDAHQFQHVHPTWSPDGSKIAFGKDGVLHIMNEDGTNVIKIGEGTKFYGDKDYDWSLGMKQALK